MQSRTGAVQAPRNIVGSALLTAAEARAAASLFSVEGLTLKAGEFIARSRKALDSERGGVPLELAAVMWVLKSGRPGWIWHIPPAAQRRLGVGRGASPALQLWAGLRLLNESAVKLAPVVAHLGLAGAAPADFWAAVVRLEELGPRVFAELAQRAHGAPGIAAYLQNHDPGDIAPLGEGTIVFRALSVGSWVQAALELCTLRHTDLEYGEGVLLPSRDQRVRRIAKKASVVGWGIANAATLVYTKLLPASIT